jgi:hypothetical protein
MYISKDIQPIRMVLTRVWLSVTWIDIGAYPICEPSKKKKKKKNWAKFHHD